MHTSKSPITAAHLEHKNDTIYSLSIRSSQFLHLLLSAPLIPHTTFLSIYNCVSSDAKVGCYSDLYTCRLYRYLNRSLGNYISKADIYDIFENCYLRSTLCLSFYRFFAFNDIPFSIY